MLTIADLRSMSDNEFRCAMSDDVLRGYAITLYEDAYREDSFRPIDEFDELPMPHEADGKAQDMDLIEF